MANISISKFVSNALRTYYERNREQYKQFDSSVYANNITLAAAAEFIESSGYSIKLGEYESFPNVLAKFSESGKMSVERNGEISKLETGYNQTDANKSYIPIVYIMGEKGVLRVSRSKIEPNTGEDSLESSVITLEEYKIEEDGIHFSHATLPFSVSANGTLTFQDGTVDTFMYTFESLKEAGIEKSYSKSLMTDMARFEILDVANYFLGRVGIEPDKTTPHQIASNNETTSPSSFEILRLKVQEMAAVISEDEKALGPKQ